MKPANAPYFAAGMIIYLIYNIRYNNASHVYIQEFENMNILTYIYLRAAVGREGGGGARAPKPP
jgi:hypothetical protein